MKSILLLFIFLSTGCAITGPKFEHDGIVVPFETNTIIANSTAEPKEFFLKVKKVILKNGYQIKTQDKDTFSFSTDYKSAAKRGTDIATDVALNIYIEKISKGSKAIIRGKFKQGLKFANSIDLGENKISLGGMKGSLKRVAWDEMYNISKIISKDLEFKRQ